jgi:RNA polymerase sigma factor
VNDLEQDVLRAKENDDALADLIGANRAFILRCASETVHRYITDSDDEWSVALMAFTEAVRDFEGGKGSFRGFAALVIKRRVLDYLRSQSRCDELAVTPEAFDGSLDEDTAGGVELRVQQRMAEESRAALDDTSERARAEIEAMQEILKGYGFSFFDLAESSPKTEKTKRSCGAAIRTLLAAAALLAKMRLAHLLPIKELSDASGVVRKILERHRKYIIAGTEILDGDYPILAGYLSYVKEGGTE